MRVMSPSLRKLTRNTVYEEKEKKTEKVKVVSHEWEDVPVIMQRCCGVSATVKVPQIQFIAESEDFPVVQQRRGRTVQFILCSWQPGVFMAVGAAMRGLFRPEAIFRAPPDIWS